MYTVEYVYNAIFDGTDDEYDRILASTFFEVDPCDMAQYFFSIIGKDNYTQEEYEHVYGLAEELENLIHRRFFFINETEENTGHSYIIAY